MITEGRESKLTYKQNLLYNRKFRVYLYEDGGTWFAAGLEEGKQDIFILSNIADVSVLERIKDMDVTGLVSWGCTADYYYEWMLFYPVGCTSLITDGSDRDKFTKADFDIIHHQVV